MNKEFNNDLLSGVHLFDDVIESLPLREGVSADDVKELASILVQAISKRNAAVIIQDQGKRRIEDFRPEIEHAKHLFDILERGFRSPEHDG